MKTLNETFEHTLRDMYYAETAIIKALPKVLAAGSHTALEAALQHHLAEAKCQIKSLDQVFKLFAKEPRGEKCDAIEDLIKECEGLIEGAKGPVAKHAVIVGICEAIEHNEIARYGTLREWAKEMGAKKVHDLLSETLDQEKAANHELPWIAVTNLNGAEGSFSSLQPVRASTLEGFRT